MQPEYAAEIELGESTDGRLVSLEFKGMDGEQGAWCMDTDNAPMVAVGLLAAQQRCAARRPAEEVEHAAAVLTAPARAMGLDALGATVSREEGISLHVSLGSTSLRFRVSSEAARELRDALDELLG